MASAHRPRRPGRWLRRGALSALAIGSIACSRGERTASIAPPNTSLASATAPVASAEPPASAAADVVSHASPAASAWPSSPPVVTGARVDGAALRKRHVARLRADRDPVTVLRGEGPADLGARLCEAVVPRRPPTTPVLLKPNLGGFDWFKDPAKSGGDDGVRGRITDPEFVRGVVRCLRARGHEAITIAEGWGATHADWLTLVRVSGYGAMAREEGVRLVAMDDDGVFDVEGDAPGKPLAVDGLAKTHVPTLLLPKILAEHLDHGLFVSLPKLKAHRFAVASIALKNMQGTVMLSDARPAYRQKWRMHEELGPWIAARKAKEPEDRAAYVRALELFAERMVDVLEVSAPDAVLVDGAPAMGGDGFQKLVPSAEHVAIGGTNPVLVDRVGAAFLGLWDEPRLARELGGHRTSPLLTRAARRFQIDLAAPSVVGDGAELLGVRRPTHFKAMAPFSIDDAADAPAPRPLPAPEASGATLPASSASAAPSPPAPSDRPEAHAAPLRDDGVKVDGRADDPAWARAPAVAFDRDWAGEPTGITTRARFLWSPAGLHVLYELEGAGLFVDRSRPTDVERDKLFQEDCVELFLAPDPARRTRYAEVEIGPLGHVFDLLVDRAARSSNAGFSSGARVATTQDAAARRAVIEALLSAPEIASALRPGARLPMGLYRMEGRAPRHYLAWSPTRTKKPNFHVPDAFGTLTLDP
jgi:uncharacterized protein (DUF362 family)